MISKAGPPLPPASSSPPGGRRGPLSWALPPVPQAAYFFFPLMTIRWYLPNSL
jgi:hypothetical protein